MKISEVAERVDLTPVTLRYYEKMGLIPAIKKEHGVRNYESETTKKKILLGLVLLSACVK